MATRLSKLRIREVSSVDRGAGEDVKVVLMKRDKAKAIAKSFTDIMKADETGILKVFDDANRALNASIESITGDESLDGADQREMITKSVKEYQNHLASILPAKIEKAIEAASSEPINKGAGKMATNEDLLKEVEELKKLNAKTARELNIAKMSPDEVAYMKAQSDPDGDAYADMTPEERKAAMKKNPLKKLDDNPVVKKMQEDMEVLKASNASLAEKLAKAEEAQNVVTLEKRAMKAGLDKKYGAVMAKAYKGDADAIVELEKGMASLVAIAKAGKLFDEFGTSETRGTNGEDPLADLNAKAEELRKADPKLSFEQAFTKVYADPANKDLREQYKHKDMVSKRIQ